MRTGALWLLVPEEALILVLLVAVFAVMFGLMRVGTFLGLVLLIVSLPVLAVVIEHLLGEMPPWVGLAVLVAVGLVILRAIASLILGARAADNMVGSLAADVVRLAVLCLFLLPFRVLARLARAGLNGFNGLNHRR